MQLVDPVVSAAKAFSAILSALPVSIQNLLWLSLSLFVVLAVVSLIRSL